MSVFLKGSRSPKWYLLYCGLAGLQFVCLTCGLFVSHRIINTFSTVIAENQVWAERLGGFSDLSAAAVAVSAPGNDIFESNDAKGEAIRLEASSEAFKRKVRMIELDIGAVRDPNEAAHLRGDLEAILAAVEQVAVHGRTIVKLYGEGQFKAAGLEMAVMDRTFGIANATINDAGNDILAFQKEHFNAQNTTVELLRSFELAGAVIVVADARGHDHLRSSHGRSHGQVRHGAGRTERASLGAGARVEGCGAVGRDREQGQVAVSGQHEP